jgi:fucose 4-O-acetylase-like acetyltransferase
MFQTKSNSKKANLNRAVSMIGRNKQFDIMLAIGIIFVVLGHSFQPAYLFYPAFSFQIALFFFVSGYFFKPQTSLINKYILFRKKSINQLLPYFALNALFAIITILLRTQGINLGADINFSSFFITPFLRADQFLLFIPAWFLINIYIINVIATVLYSKNLYINMVIVAITCVVVCPLLKMEVGNWADEWKVSGIRIVAGFFFFSLGFVFKIVEPVLKKFILNPVTIVLFFIIINILNTNFGDITYNLLFANIGDKNVVVPIITTLCIILIVYIISYHLSNILKEKSIVYLIGQNTYSIMVWHFASFYLVNCCLYFFKIIPFSELSHHDFLYCVEKTWLLYVVPGLAIPILISMGFRYVKQKVLLVKRKVLRGAAIVN